MKRKKKAESSPNQPNEISTVLCEGRAGANIDSKPKFMSDEEYAKECLKSVHLDLVYTEVSTGIKRTGAEFIDYMVKLRREHLNRGANKRKAQPQCPNQTD